MISQDSINLSRSTEGPSKFNNTRCLICVWMKTQDKLWAGHGNETNVCRMPNASVSMIGTWTSPEPKKGRLIWVYKNLPSEQGVIEETILNFESEEVGVERQTTWTSRKMSSLNLYNFCECMGCGYHREPKFMCCLPLVYLCQCLGWPGLMFNHTMPDVKFVLAFKSWICSCNHLNGPISSTILLQVQSNQRLLTSNYSGAGNCICTCETVIQDEDLLQCSAWNLGEP